MNCIVCGNHIPEREGRGRPPVYCSVFCRKVSLARYLQDYRAYQKTKVEPDGIKESDEELIGGLGKHEKE